MLNAANNTHTLNEVLNGDYVHLTALLEENAPINILGLRGEGPIHMAIYRKDFKMLEMLLKHTPRADINFKNSSGNTALHIAALLGLPKMLKHLYSVSTVEERFQLMLEIRNNEGETSYDIALKPVLDSELDLTRMYAVSDDVSTNTLDSVRQPMIAGRRECADFLREQMKLARENKVRDSIGVLIDCNADRRKANAILRGGIAGTDAERIYSAALDYPKALDEMAWRKRDIDFFLDYEPGVREVVVGTHSRDLVARALKSGTASYNLQEHIIKLHTKGLDVEEERWKAPPERIGKEWI